MPVRDDDEELENEDDDVETDEDDDTEEDEDEDEDEDDDDSEEGGDDSDDDEEVVDEEDEADAPKEKTKSKSISPLSHIREKLNKESIMAEIFKELESSHNLRSESVTETGLGFNEILVILPRLSDVARLIFMNYADIKKEASWEDLIPDTMRELDIFASLFKIKLPDKAIELVVQGAYKNLDLWCPGGPEKTYKHWEDTRTSVAKEAESNTEEDEDVTIETAMEMVKAEGNVILSKEKYTKYKTAYYELHPDAKKKKKKKASK